MSVEPITWVLLFLLGTFTGLLSGILGVSGGFLIVPALTLWGIPVIQAVATSLVSVFLSCVSGSVQNWWTDKLNIRASLQLAAFGIPAAQLGAWLGSWLPDDWLSLNFAVMLFGTIYLINLRQGIADRALSEELLLPPSEEKNNQVDVQTPDVASVKWQFAQIGLIAGLMSGLFGIGGGIVIVPLMMLLSAEPMQAAVPISLGAMVAIAASALVQHTWNGHVLWLPGLCLGAGGILGAQVGTRLLPHLPATLINRLFKLLLFVLALYMLGRAFAAGLP